MKPLDWRGAVDPTLRLHPSLGDIKDVNGLVKSYISAQQMIGADKVSVPKDDSPAEAWNEFYTKLGRPETVEGYKFQPKEYSLLQGDGASVGKADADWVKQVAHKAGLNEKQAGVVYEELHTRYQGIIDGFKNKKTETDQQWLDTLHQKWRGSDFDVNIQAAQKGVRAFGGDELADVLESSGLGNHPALVETFANIGKALGEDKTFGGRATNGGFVASAAEARAEIGRLNLDKDFQKAYINAKDPGHRTAVEKMSKLFKSAYPEGSES
jgi:hypothetical protein